MRPNTLTACSMTMPRKAKSKIARPWDRLPSRPSSIVEGIIEHVLPAGEIMVVEEGPQLLRLQVVGGTVSLRGGFLYVIRITGPQHPTGKWPYASAKSVRGYGEPDALDLLEHLMPRWNSPPNNTKLHRGWLRGIVESWPKWKTFDGPYNDEG